MDENRKNQVAKLIYTRNLGTEAQIIEMLEITMQQFARWAQAEQWEETRKALLDTKEEQLRMCYNQLSNLNMAIMEGTGYPNEKEAMTQKRLASTIEHLEMDASVSQTITVAKEYIDWLTLGGDRDFAKESLQLFDKFIKQKLKNS